MGFALHCARVGCAVALVAAVACEEPAPQRLPIEALMDPETCAGCHADHYREWSGSMHAYASDDPIFLAMNARAQREVEGGVGDFCVRCHAPMALWAGASRDGTNLPELPRWQQGVTCFSCHAVTGIEERGFHTLTMATDGVMRAGLDDPIESGAHGTEYSPLHDRLRADSNLLCATCHVETLPSWEASFYSGDGPGALSCGRCHMNGRDEVAAQVADAPVRRRHDHAVPAVDLAVSDWPERAAQRAEVTRLLDGTVAASLCVDAAPELVEVSIDLENLAAGHAWPGGALQSRRAWAEVVAWSGDEVAFASGDVGADEALWSRDDPQLFWLGVKATGDDGAVATMPWQAASLEERLLPAPTTLDVDDIDYVDPHVKHAYTFVSALPVDRVTLRLRLRQVGLDIVDDLIASGDLAPAVKGELVEHSLASTELEWRADLGQRCVPLAR
jgi:hypothetical protein